MSLLQNQSVLTFIYSCFGFLARSFISAHFKEPIRQRVEVTTPIGSWKRASEAVYLWSSGLDPYSGNLFHEYPINLQFYKILTSYANMDLTFAAVDVVVALLLQRSAFNQLIISGQNKEAASSRSLKVLLIYLFSPITILSCAGASTSIFTNFLVAVINFVLPMKPFRALTCVLCAFLACSNIHYSSLILPIFLSLEYSSRRRQDANEAEPSSVLYYQRPEFLSSMLNSTLIYVATLITLITTSYLLMGSSLSFLKATYLFSLGIQDLTPNIGMFWYLFTEMFEQFLDFFVYVVQINAFIHVLPISICLRDNPFFAFYVIILTSTIFQPYPSLSNISLITCLLPQWLDLFEHTKRGLIVSCASIVCMSLWPIFWHLWISMGTANSNFYFGATLAFNASLILFMIDLLNSYGYMKAKSKLDESRKDHSQLSAAQRTVMNLNE